MKKLFFTILIGLMLCSPLFAASPTVEEDNIIIFDTADQETSTSFTIYAISWSSTVSSEIGATDGFLLENAAGVPIAQSEATTEVTQYVLSIPGGLVVSGLKAEDLDAGKLFIYGKKR